MFVTPEHFYAFLGRSGDQGPNGPDVWTHIESATAMVRAYTRDRGFDPDGKPADDLAAVITSCAARQYTNPAQTVQTAIVDASVTMGTFRGWTLPELAILHRYRVRAQ